MALELPGAAQEAPGAVPGGPEAVPESPGAVPGGPEAVPESPGAVRGGPEAVRESPGTVQGGPEAARESPGTVQGGPEAAREAPGAVPGGPEAAREAPGAVQGDPEAARESPGAVPGGPEVADAEPKGERPDPKAENRTPKAESIVPPQPLEIADIPYPAGAASTSVVEVRARLHVAADGSVKQVEIESGAGEPFDTAVREGAARFRFHPAAWNGQPVEVILPFSQTFLPPPAPKTEPTDAGPARDAVLAGIVRERGSRSAAPRATVVARTGAGEFTATTDEEGRFELALPAGDADLLVAAPGCRKFVQHESLRTGETLKVKYLVSRESFGRFEATVTAQRDRTEVSRTTLEGREIHQVPGTFGDPFRVMNLLPGVTSAMSLMPMPVVRGSSPGSTGFFLDQVRLPLLFHLFNGPAVIHPEFIDRVDFYPGGFPVKYGQFSGGIVDGLTRAARGDESGADIDLNLNQAGLFVRKGLPDLGANVTAAGRIGYPGLLLSLAIPTLSLSYWDYQVRLDGGNPERGWTAFVYGADDELKTAPTPPPGQEPDLQTVLHFQFHRADIRGRFGTDERGAELRLVGGYDATHGPGGSGSTAKMIQPMLRGNLRLAPALRLRAGGDVVVRDIGTETGATATSGNQGQTTSETVAKVALATGVLTVGALWADVPWEPNEAFTLVPGVRGEVYHQEGTTKWAADPRLLARWRVRPGAVGGLWLKGATGLYHQPARLPMAVPGMDQAPLDRGLSQAWQNSVGVETALAPGVELDVQTYFNWMDPVIFDFSTNAQTSDVIAQAPTTLPWQIPEDTSGMDTAGKRLDETLAKMMTPRLGRSYGVEFMLRKRDSARLFGWIAYTLSRSERQGEDGSWQTFDFDRTHILNVVAGTRLPHNWEIGGRLLFQTGTPITTLYGYNAGRTGYQVRADLRIDKRATWDKWMLDFYVDVVNTLVTPESGGLVGAYQFRYVIPSVGFRAVL